MKYFIFLFFLFSPIVVSAATISALMSVSPESPRPGEQVTVSTSVLGTIPFGSVYIWTLDGEVIAESENATSITLDAPPRGGSHEIAMTIIFNDSIVAQGAYKLTSGSVNIEWEGESTGVPLATVRPLIPQQGKFIATAIVDLVQGNTQYSQKDIYYEWTINETVQKTASGFGRSTFRGNAPLLSDTFTLTVKALTRDRLAEALDSVVLTAAQPRIAIYEQTPLGGVHFETLIRDGFAFNGDEVSFIAYPVFADREEGKLSWFIDDERIELDIGDQRAVVFRKTGEGRGVFEARAEFENRNFLQRATSSFLLQF